MGEKKWVDDGHYRVTSSDGKKSWLMKDEGIGQSDTCEEVAEHWDDGTTHAYDYVPSIFGDDKGAPKK